MRDSVLSAMRNRKATSGMHMSIDEARRAHLYASNVTVWEAKARKIGANATPKERIPDTQHSKATSTR